MLTELSIPASCLEETWFIRATGTRTSGGVLGNPADPNCWPGTRSLGTVISPAICPSGYTQACKIDPLSRGDASETLWACCPSNFACDPGTYSCVKHIAPQTCRVTDVNNRGAITVTSVVLSRVNAHSVRVAFHSSDVAGQSISSTGSSGPTAAPSPTETSSLSTSISSATPQGSNADRFPAAGWIGIGVASALGVVFVILGIFWLVRRRHRNTQQHQQDKPAMAISSPKPVKNYAEIFSISRPSELNAVPGVYELESKARNENKNKDNNNTLTPEP
ncbi:hypothetical protein F4859DRAFT_486767 [Xylaria cf. heliscus]|nr:hypothetical protein F4859DRAFT_486767 [Xylaria cf. heliscus]